MPRPISRFATLMACSVGLATMVPYTTATAQAKPPLIDQDLRLLAEFTRFYTTQATSPYVRTSVGVSWDRTVYEALPESYAIGEPCYGSLVVWAQCLNNPNDPAVSALNNGSTGLETNTAGEVISREIASTPMTGVNRPTEGSSSAKGVTTIGSNSVYAAARGGFEREVFFPSFTNPSGGSTFDEKLWLSAGAISIWSDTFTPNYTGSLTIGLSNFLHGSTDTENSFLGQIPLGGNRDAEATLQFGILDPTQQVFYGSEFEYQYWQDYPSRLGPALVGGLTTSAASAYGLTGYSVTLNVVAGRTYSMAMGLNAVVYQNGLLDLFGTSKVDYFEVPQGGTVNFGGGNFALRTAGVGGPVSTVPEPTTAVLMVAGCLGMLALRRRAVGASARR